MPCMTDIYSLSEHSSTPLPGGFKGLLESPYQNLNLLGNLPKSRQAFPSCYCYFTDVWFIIDYYLPGHFLIPFQTQKPCRPHSSCSA